MANPLNFTSNNDTILNHNNSRVEDVKSLAASYMMYKIGEFINKSYFPILVPVGIIGNILSFLVMVQKHNRNMSFSLYISALAITDTIPLIVALCRYLDNVDEIDMPQDLVWFCTFTITIMLMSSMCSMLFILNMTFERVYGILRPHKAASFNTVKRAKITIICVVIFSILYNSPHIFLSSSVARQCVPYGQAMKVVYGQFYYWLSFILQFALPFVLLLSMNCIIIHTLRTRVKFNVTISDTKTDCEKTGQRKGQSQGHDKGQSSKMQNTERQIYIMLLLITFGFLILLTPAYAFYLYQMFYDYDKLPYAFAGFYLYNSVSQKAIYTNNGIDFFLYVMSGKKFRTDLVHLFKIRKTAEDLPFSSSNVSAATSIKTLSECVE